MPTVLVAEDELDIRESFVDILDYAGYNVIQAEDGGAAFELACREHPDIILLDVMMPVMDGFQVLAKLKENPSTARIPVVMLTAIPPGQGEQNAMNLGVEHYLDKPCDPEILVVTVKATLREAETAAGPEAQWDGRIALDTIRVNLGKAESAMGQEANGDGRIVRQEPTSALDTSDNRESQEFIRIGNPGLDQSLGGGIPVGSLTLIEGASAAGKSALSQHLAYGSLRAHLGVAYFSFENTIRSMITQMASVGLDVSGYLRADELRICPLEVPTEDGEAESLIAPLLQQMERLPMRYRTIIVDAITDFRIYCQDQTIIWFFAQCKRLCDDGRTIILVVHTSTFEEKMFIRLRARCDVHLRLCAENVGGKLIKTLEVCKVHNAELPTGNIVAFDVVPGLGMRVNAIKKVKLS